MVGKTTDSSLTRELLEFQPTYRSFRSFMRAIGGLPEEEEAIFAPAKKKETIGLWLPGMDDDLL